MSQLQSWARVLGGSVCGISISCPGPGHGRDDRSLSVTPSVTASDGFIAYSHAGDDWQACRDYVRARLGLSPFKPGNALGRLPPPRAAKADDDEVSDNRETAKWLWQGRELITSGCPVGSYLRQTRGYCGLIPPTLGYLPGNGKHPPAMIAAFGFCDEPEPGTIAPPEIVTGVHLTRLTSDGQKAPVDPVKIMLGPTAGLPIVLAPANDGLAIYITEGIESGLSVKESYGAGVWAAASAGNMPKIAEALPNYVECVRIFAHRDEAGLRFAKEAARLIGARKIDVKIHAFG
jgi:hypothetical protein